MTKKELKNTSETHLLFKENKIITKNISNGILRSLISWNLTKQPLHGYAIMKKIDEFFEPQINTGIINKTSNSKIYPVLNQMEKEKLLKSYNGMNNNNKVKFYELTDKGKQIFETLKHDLQKQLKRNIVKEYINVMTGIKLEN